ncbi:nicotinate-nucleotide--dimethylbenzimidazole phosphoribosyltransferase [Telmatospirillum sp. J64-1]|uniref:nicotinate-nucleotide--dimethylbenzimidazole phosphoribosyltransferase n=1 Tax=Telmatospirillum sp. J64-1 TaxID=2502183 RepID=UPI00115CDD18|nr:nicotinate-nucleotide--dimethylbenzimidazole phosphoribosyltransferase [Telmatospirillum sp. J64-1]
MIACLDDLRRLLADLPGPDAAARAAWAEREPQLTKPAGSLGRLEELAGWLSAWQGRHPPRLDRPAARIFAGNHGVVAKGVSAYPADVTVQMVANFQRGGAAINQLCRLFGTELQVVALELDRPTADFSEGPAMTEEEAVAALKAGLDSVPAECDLLCIGEMGIGNTTSAAALCLGLYGGSAADWVGPGTGLDDRGLRRKAEVIEQAATLHGGADPLDLLRRLGGRELAAMAGAVLGARLKRVPVMLDGYVTTAAAAPLEAFRSGALDHCLVAHASAEPGHRRLIERLGKRALLDLGMRLGEGSGAALAVGLAQAAVACHTGMATFAEAGVSGKE